MEQDFLFALISTGIYLIGAIPFWKDIITGRTMPHFITYLLWLVLVSFNVFVLFKNNEYNTLIPSGLMLLSLTGATLYGVLVWKKININWFDWFCFGLGVMLIIYWFLSKNVLHTVTLTLLIDFIAFLPTFKKGWILPWTESILIYLMSAVGQIATILSLSGFEIIENMLFWGYLVIANFSFFLMVALRRWYLQGWSSIFR